MIILYSQHAFYNEYIKHMNDTIMNGEKEAKNIDWNMIAVLPYRSVFHYIKQQVSLQFSVEIITSLLCDEARKGHCNKLSSFPLKEYLPRRWRH